jgi:hypothetical protein
MRICRWLERPEMRAKATTTSFGSNRYRYVRYAHPGVGAPPKSMRRHGQVDREAWRLSVLILLGRGRYGSNLERRLQLCYPIVAAKTRNRLFNPGR